MDKVLFKISLEICVFLGRRCLVLAIGVVSFSSVTLLLHSKLSVVAFSNELNVQDVFSIIMFVSHLRLHSKFLNSHFLQDLQMQKCRGERESHFADLQKFWKCLEARAFFTFQKWLKIITKP